jgi:hypothetical protein
VDQLFRLVPGKDEHLGLRRNFSDLTSGFEAIEFRHRHVEHGDFGTEAFCLRYGITSCLHFSADLPTFHGFDHGTKSAPHYLMVICQKDSSHWLEA